MTPTFRRWPALEGGRRRAAELLARGQLPPPAPSDPADPVALDEHDGVGAALFVREELDAAEAHLVVFECDRGAWHPDFEHVDAWVAGARPARGGVVLTTSRAGQGTTGGRLVECLAGVVASDVVAVLVRHGAASRRLAVAPSSGAFVAVGPPGFELVAERARGG